MKINSSPGNGSSGKRLSLHVKVIPGARNDGVMKYGDLVKVKVRTAPEQGRANLAVELLVAQALGLNPNQVQVSAGHTSSLKTLQLAGLTPEALATWLASLPGGH